jgi:hypothetical protein
MALKLSQSQNDLIIVFEKGKHRRRCILNGVNLEKLNKLSLTLQLDDRRKSRLAFKLAHILEVYDMAGIVNEMSADSAKVRWLGEIEKSIKRIAKAKPNDAHKFAEAVSAMELFGGGTMPTIEKWFDDANFILDYAKKAKEVWNDKSGSKESLLCRVELSESKERLLYGEQLPRLYENFSGKKFGISKNGDKPQKVTGVCFVMEAAEVIGIPPTSPSNIASHWNAVKKKKAKAKG